MTQPETGSKMNIAWGAIGLLVLAGIARRFMPNFWALGFLGKATVVLGVIGCIYAALWLFAGKDSTSTSDSQ